MQSQAASNSSDDRYQRISINCAGICANKTRCGTASGRDLDHPGSREPADDLAGKGAGVHRVDGIVGRENSDRDAAQKTCIPGSL